jgi:hypothetical protein
MTLRDAIREMARFCQMAWGDAECHTRWRADKKRFVADIAQRAYMIVEELSGAPQVDSFRTFTAARMVHSAVVNDAAWPAATEDVWSSL